MLPAALSEVLSSVLGGTIAFVQPVFGGDINYAAQIDCGSASYFVKWNANSPDAMFATEAEGLRLLRGAGALRVPDVIAQGEADGIGYLVLEWIETGNKRAGNVMEAFGSGLAELHRQQAAQHGLDQNNFIGRLPQINTPTSSWISFYREQRIGYQMEVARQRGRLPRRREDLLTRLMERLDHWLDDEAITPSLLHGDLWGGNYLVDEQGRAVLIDPAVYYGHREMDLAMTELFGGFATRFYEAYQAAYPLVGYDERRSLYQLYYILVHLNLFGEAYGGQVDSIAAYYAGPR